MESEGKDGAAPRGAAGEAGASRAAKPAPGTQRGAALSRLVASSTAASSGKPASASRPASRLPVAVLTQPIMAGPQKPPDRPMVLISAITPAASAPLMKFEGIAQNTV